MPGMKDSPIYKAIHENVAQGQAAYDADLARQASTPSAPAAAIVAAPLAASTAALEGVQKGESSTLVVLKATQLNPTRKAMLTEHGVIYGIGGGANIDKDNEALQPDHLVAAAHGFCAKAERTFKSNHTDAIACDLVESAVGRPILKSGLVLKAGDGIPEADEVIGFDTLGEATHWFVACKPTDPAMVAKAKAGELTGFSWAGLVEKKAVPA